MTGTCDTFKMLSFSVMQSTFRFSNVEILAVPTKTVTSEDVCRNIRNVNLNNFVFQHAVFCHVYHCSLCVISIIHILLLSFTVFSTHSIEVTVGNVWPIYVRSARKQRSNTRFPQPVLQPSSNVSVASFPKNPQSSSSGEADHSASNFGNSWILRNAWWTTIRRTATTMFGSKLLWWN